MSAAEVRLRRTLLGCRQPAARIQTRLSPWPDGLERAFAGIGTAVYQTMWGPTEFGPVWGRLKGWDLTDRLQEIHVPTLLTVGRFDECPIDHVAEMQSRIPQAELVVFEQGSHLHFFDEREHYMAVVNAFLDRVESAARPTCHVSG